MNTTMIKTYMCISKNRPPFGRAWVGCLNGTLYIVLCTLFVACSGDDLEQYAQRADNADEIGFMPKTENVTRGYSLENPHPATMGVFGFHDLSGTTITRDGYDIFKNATVSYANGAWTYSPVRYWPEYSAYSSFDFFGYMPYNQNATLTYFDGDYTLSFDVNLSANDMMDGNNIPLVCNLPHHKDYPGDIVNFDMDQTLTGFQLMFKLGTKMSKVREFEITKVVVSGVIPNKGTFSRTYAYKADKTWKLAKTEWTKVTTGNLSLDIRNSAGNLNLTDDEFHDWGSPFFAIPVKSFMPTISVTYNVKVAVDGTVTRQTMTNNIVFNEANFASLKTKDLTAGKINTLKIAIVPDHLYVLADADQYIGTLTIENL